MKGLYFNGKKLSLRNDIPKPRRKKGDALIRVLKAGICNTDIEITKGYMGFKGIPGHEFIGVVEKSSNKNITGKRVCGEINLACGRCLYCVKGMRNHCPSRTVLGILGKNGCFAQFVTLPEKNLHIIPDGVSNDEAVFIEPLAACVEALKQVKIKKSDEVAIIGDGKLGLLMVQVIKLNTRKLLLIGRHKKHLEIGKTFGVAEAVYEKSKIVTELKKKKCDIVIDCTGSAEGLLLSMDIVKPLGKIILKSTFAAGVPLNLAPIVINEVALIGSRCGPFKDAISAVKKESVNLRPLISRRFLLSEGLEAMEYAKKRGVLKVIIDIS